MNKFMELLDENSLLFNDEKLVEEFRKKDPKLNAFIIALDADLDYNKDAYIAYKYNIPSLKIPDYALETALYIKHGFNISDRKLYLKDAIKTDSIHYFKKTFENDTSTNYIYFIFKNKAYSILEYLIKNYDLRKNHIDLITKLLFKYKKLKQLKILYDSKNKCDLDKNYNIICHSYLDMIKYKLYNSPLIFYVIEYKLYDFAYYLKDKIDLANTNVNNVNIKDFLEKEFPDEKMKQILF